MADVSLMECELISEADLDRNVENCERRVEQAKTLLSHAEGELSRQVAICGKIESELAEAKEALQQAVDLTRGPRSAD